MKFYIEHECTTQVTTVWEVEADSCEEAIKKLDKAEAYDSIIADTMDSPTNANFEKVNRIIPEPYGSYHVLSEYTEEG